MNALNARNIKRQNCTQNYECVFIISGGSSLRFAPSFYHVLPKSAAVAKVTNSTPQTEASGTKAEVTPSKPSATVVPKSTGNQCCKSGNNISKMNPSKNLFFFVSAGQKRKRRRSRWSSGIYVKKKHASPHTSREDAHLATDEEEEDENDEDAEKGGREKQMAMDVKSGSTPDEGSRIEPGGLERMAISVNNSLDGMERGNQEPLHPGNNDEAEIEKLTATRDKMVNVEEEERTPPGTRGTVREDASTGEMCHHMTQMKTC